MGEAITCVSNTGCAMAFQNAFVAMSEVAAMGMAVDPNQLLALAPAVGDGYDEYVAFGVCMFGVSDPQGGMGVANDIMTCMNGGGDKLSERCDGAATGRDGGVQVLQ